ncbi:MAG: hypothetical protein K2H34_10630, partial [Lachnospiraceae bacterium]|nr:hypothetical protein [Lachnospiraceae bacterium]
HYFAVSVLSVCTGFGIAFLAEHVHSLCYRIHHSWEKTDKVRTTSSSEGLDMFQPTPPLQAAGHVTLAAFANILRTLAHCLRE